MKFFDKLQELSFTNVIALMYVLMTFIFDFMLLFVHFPSDNRDVIIGLSNILNSGGLIMILSFFFGSSKNSKDKDDAITNLTNHASALGQQFEKMEVDKS